MEKKKKFLLLALGCTLSLIFMVLPGPLFAECTTTAAGLESALGQCVGDDLDCYAEIAGKIPSCSGNILWHYMILFSPDDSNLVLNRFVEEVPIEYANLLNAVAEEANRVRQNEENAGNRATSNEYPFGQGVPYTQ